MLTLPLIVKVSLKNTRNYEVSWLANNLANSMEVGFELQEASKYESISQLRLFMHLSQV